MKDDYIEVVWTSDQGKKIEYINRKKIDGNINKNNIKKRIMKKVMIASVALPLMYSGIDAIQKNMQFNMGNIANYSNVLPYNLPESIEEKVDNNINYIKKYKVHAIENELSNVSKFEDIIEYASKNTGLSKYLLMSVPAVEAGGEIDILRAKSSKGALGPAQFMEETARYRGLKIDNYEDERMDPTIALPEMAEYLKDLVDQFDGKIHLGLAAYNWGPGNVESLLNSNNRNDKVFIDRLPSETKQFIIKVLSRETLMRKNMINYEKKTLFSVMIADAEDHIVRKGETLYDIAGEYNANLDEILELNPIKNPDNVKHGQKIKVKR